MDIEKTNYLTVDQLCDLLNLKESMVRNLLFKKQIPHIKMGRLIRFDKRDIEKWVESRKFASKYYQKY